MSTNITNCWFGTITPQNIEQVATIVREILKERFCIAEALYCDSKHADLRLISPDCKLDSQWTTEPSRKGVRVFPPNDDDDRWWFGFSAGGYLWSFGARADNDAWNHDDYRYPYFHFEGDRFTVTDRAPAGEGYLHKRVFGAIRQEGTD